MAAIAMPAALGRRRAFSAANSARIVTAGSGERARCDLEYCRGGHIAGTALQTAHLPASVLSAVLVGVDLGPNLSVTGSLATLLWLHALRRDGLHVKALDFLKLGLLVMPPALILALCGLLLAG